ncbi:MAG TPA: glycerophosphodiester phosphodiesterase [Polyangiaceae bacterium LLY-WYZ-14_1]|nr:glycerophosphodiester phosphodiesterase [Polyangiaceae bacterium LLY-WYZ-14_1]
MTHLPPTVVRMLSSFVLAGGLLLGSGCGDDGTEDGRAFFFREEPLVIAHRGGPSLGPEHTIETFQAGAEAGADVLELDVHLTRDGEIVVLHDDTVDRTTDGTGLVKEMTLAEVRALDAGYAWSPDGGETFPFRGQGVRIPTMGEVFEAFPDAWYVIEIKQADPPMVDPFLAELDRYRMRARSVVASFRQEVLLAFRERAPDVLTSFSEEEVLTLFFLPMMDEPGYLPPAELLQLPPTSAGIEVFTPRFLERTDRLGLPIHAWTINDRQQMDELLGKGIRGLITDYPDRARAAVDAFHAAGTGDP